MSLVHTVRAKAAGAKRRLGFLATLTAIPTHADTGKTRLAIMTGELEVGGVGRVLMNIITAIPRDRYEIYIFTTDPRINAWAPEFAQHVDRIIDIPPTIGRSLPPGYVRRYLEAYLAKNRMDIVFITNSVTAYEALPGIRTSKSKHAAVYDLMHTHGRPQDDDAFLKLSMPFDSYIDTRIVISQYLKEYFCNKYPVSPKKVRVIYNGLDAATLAYKPDIARGQKFLQLTPKEHAISYLGRLQSDKSPHRLVELGAQLKNELDAQGMFIAIVGEGELEPELRERAKVLGVLGKQVRFFPFTKHPMDVCAASQYTIITSDLEGISMAALESMYMRTPVIAPAVGGFPEIIDDGQEGFTTSFSDRDDTQKVAALAAATRRALALSTKDRQKMGQQARQKVIRTFSTMGENYLELFGSHHT